MYASENRTDNIFQQNKGKNIFDKNKSDLTLKKLHLIFFRLPLN
jgi:hypothetical protein